MKIENIANIFPDRTLRIAKMNPIPAKIVTKEPDQLFREINAPAIPAWIPTIIQSQTVSSVAIAPKPKSLKNAAIMNGMLIKTWTNKNSEENACRDAIIPTPFGMFVMNVAKIIGISNMNTQHSWQNNPNLKKIRSTKPKMQICL